MFIILWEYLVKPDRQAEFETAYDRDGPWADLFRNGSGYIGTELIHDSKNPSRYITIDRWESAELHENFLHRWRNKYEALDSYCAEMAESETRIGSFESVNH